MIKSTYNSTLTLFLSLFIMSGCATPLPPSYNKTSDARVLDGPVLALAGEGDLVVAANHDGLFMKKGEGPWVKQEAPGIRKWSQITCLAVDKGQIYLGSDGEGLHILSEGTWEVKTSRYGGLPDDGVLSIAFDGEGEGLPGSSLWVGTRDGIAGRSGDDWKVYKPEGDWLITMIGKSASGAGKVYVGTGFKLGRKGEDSKLFRPPVTAIGVGARGLVFGNKNSRLAVLNQDALATYYLRNDYNITRLIVDGPVIWAGTDKGLLWGGLRGEARGKPWPTHQIYLSWSGTLFGSRDTQPFDFRWKLLGYNSARVVDLFNKEVDLWVAYRSEESSQLNKRLSRNENPETAGENQISAIRLFINIGEYIARKGTPQYENYGPSAGVKGEPTAMYLSPEGQRLWIGTTQGLWELEQ